MIKSQVIFSRCRPIGNLWQVSLVVGIACLLTGGVYGQDEKETQESSVEVSPELRKKYDAFEKMVSGTKLVGSFTIVGQESGKLQKEEYFIKSVRKLPEGDLWMFRARVKYGENDYTVPLPLEVKWAGDTPMITLTDFKILGQGPFSARVVFHQGKYAGTWSHGDVGGHLFGTIAPLSPEEKDAS